MSSAEFDPRGGLTGVLRPPGDKSISHRALLLAALADGESELRGLSTGEDVANTARAVTAMGAKVRDDRVIGGQLHGPETEVDCGNSGTGLRLLAGWCAPQPWTTTLTGDESVRGRPMARIVTPLRQMGAAIETAAHDRAPLTVAGRRLRGIDYSLPVASAQIKSTILLAGLSAVGETVVRESLPTRAHTEEMLLAAGADIEVRPGEIRLRPSPLRPFALDIPADPSQAAFWVVAATIVPDSDLELRRVYVGPARAAFLDVLRRMGARIDVEPVDTGIANLRVRSAPLRATVVGGAEIPGLIDEIPVLAVAAAVAEGETVFRDAAELKVKETDRIATMTTELRAVGVEVEPRADGLVVQGGAIAGGSVRSHGDHRVAMALAVAGLVARAPVRVEGWEAVSTSYPTFEEDLRSCVS